MQGDEERKEHVHSITRSVRPGIGQVNSIPGVRLLTSKGDNRIGQCWHTYMIYTLKKVEYETTAHISRHAWLN